MNESNLTTRLQSSTSSPRPPSALLPGTLLAGRYRVVAPLGHGGMGDVYRADDLKLGQAVALKFLPPAFRNDEARRQRLRDEVKVARLVAHPSVCRVWDLIEADGHEFLAMEYVDGEDLASLLRRIGRLPEERAVRMARELCAGLSAIHEQGILHRDLKPANVMVDGRGRVRIADFGLAALAESVSGAEVSAGTPAYMSPEQRHGREVTVRSDIYALGLVLYEVFTGHRALVRPAGEGGDATPSRPSSHVKDLDPTIERVIERCLDPDPLLRPASAVAVAASLPGADPLAAALAAGETPAPDQVAAVGGVGGLRPPIAIGSLAVIAVGIVLVVLLGDRVSPFFLDLDKPPEVLVHEARQVLADLGPAGPRVDDAHGFVLEGEQGGPRRLVFWYRQSPHTLAEGRRLHGGVLSFTHPRPAIPGMTGVRLDAHGALIEYVRVPALDEADATRAIAWSSVFERVGLDPGAAREAAPTAIPPVLADGRYAWDIEATGGPLRAEGASFRGRPVWFKVMDASDTPERDTAGAWVYGPLLLLLLGMIVARRNLRSGRGDREGARRIAGFAVLWWAVGPAFLEPRKLEAPLVGLWVMNAVLLTTACWVIYLALEPIVRRRWPDALVAWTRLLRGRIVDPLVGRDALIGVLGGVVLVLIGQSASGVLRPGFERWPASPALLAGGWYVLGNLITGCGNAVLFCLVALMVLALLRQVVHKPWAAFLVSVGALQILLGGAAGWRAALVGLPLIGLYLGLLTWSGLLATAIALTVSNFLGSSLMTTHLGAWYADSAVAGILATLAFAAWGFYASLGGRPLFGDSNRGVT